MRGGLEVPIGPEARLERGDIITLIGTEKNVEAAAVLAARGAEKDFGSSVYQRGPAEFMRSACARISIWRAILIRSDWGRR